MKTLGPILLLITTILGCADLNAKKEFTTKSAIANEDVVIAPGGWRSWQFKVEKDGHINGSYSTESGIDHEIIFYVTDTANKESIERNQTGQFYFRSLDSSKNRHLTSVLRELPAGDYHLLFHNESKTAEHKVKVRMSIEE